MMTRKILTIAAMALTMSACGPKAGQIFSEEWNTPYGTAPFSKIAEAEYAYYTGNATGRTIARSTNSGIVDTRNNPSRVKACDTANIRIVSTSAIFDRSGNADTFNQSFVFTEQSHRSSSRNHDINRNVISFSRNTAECTFKMVFRRANHRRHRSIGNIIL